jgi:hypothetical protein
MTTRPTHLQRAVLLVLLLAGVALVRLTPATAGIEPASLIRPPGTHATSAARTPIAVDAITPSRTHDLHPRATGQVDHPEADLALIGVGVTGLLGAAAAGRKGPARRRARRRPPARSPPRVVATA